MAQKKTDIVVVEENEAQTEPVLDANAAELNLSEDFAVVTEVNYEETANPIVPIVAALVSAGVTAFGFWLFTKLKARKSKKALDATIIFDPDGTTDEMVDQVPEAEEETDKGE